MATLTTYSFAKRKNSTAQPSGGSQIDATLKDGTSLLAPVFLISAASITFNYCSFEGRYYNVTDVKSVNNGLWEVYCDVDVLATYKSTIGGTEAVILYATGGSNDIIDQRIGVKSPLDVRSEAVLLSGDFSGFTDDREGIAIISVTGVGSFGNYLISASDVPELLKDIETWEASAITDVATGLQQLAMGGSAADNLKSAIYLPIILSSTANFDAATQIKLGAYPCTSGGSPLMGMRVHNPFLSASAVIDIPWKYSDWRRNAPYTKVFLYLPIFGLISITSSDIINESQLSILYSLNMLGGDMAFMVRGTTSGRKIATGSANIAMQSPYGSANIAGGKALSGVGVAVGSLAAVAAGVVTGGAATLAIGGGIAAASGGLISALGGETAGGGGLSGSAVTGLDLGIMCTTVSRDLSDSQASLNPIIGKPVMAKHTVQTYSGFVQTDGFEVAGSMTDAERESINSMLDRGIYYE